MNKFLITGGSGFIGTNLIKFLIDKGNNNIINYDKNSPVFIEQSEFWVQGDIMDESFLLETLNKYKPNVLIHLAARTDTLSDNLEDYNENHLGTRHVLNAVRDYGGIDRLIVTSTQYVYKDLYSPKPSGNTDFKPYTVYGQSKVLTEQYTHSAALNCTWTIVRPTNIWGPWHMRYPLELWKMIDQGLYFHPVKHPVKRTYGYVKNIVHQIFEILNSNEKLVHKQMFYLGDPSIDSYEWLNQLSFELRNKGISRFPKFLFNSIAKFGDLLTFMKIPFPLYSRRFNNMIEDYPAPTEVTVELFGQFEPNLKKNVEETVSWLRSDGKKYFKYWDKK